jgi:hypothetical protein
MRALWTQGMNMQWQQLIEFLGGVTAISVTLGFLGKKAIDAFMKGRVESHKKNLEKIAIEHSVRFQSLHSERATIIKDFYSNLSNLDESLHSALRRFQPVGEPDLKEKVNKLADDFNSLRNYFLPNRIFFEKELCSKIDNILEVAKGVFFDITTFPVSPQDASIKHDRETVMERHNFWEKARSIHENEITSLKSELEDEFRTILGINA